MDHLDRLPLVGGHLTLDFVNTSEERGHPAARDALTSAAELCRWGQRLGLLAPATAIGPGADAERDRAIAAREILHTLLTARVQGSPPAPAELAALGALASEAYTAARLAPDGDGAVVWRWRRSDLATVRHAVVASAVVLLAAPPSPRLKRCPGEACGWFFLDTTKRGNRRWCEMRECGEHAKAARRRARQGGEPRRPAGPAGPAAVSRSGPRGGS